MLASVAAWFMLLHSTRPRWTSRQSRGSLFLGDLSAPNLFQKAAFIQVFGKGVVKEVCRLSLDVRTRFAGVLHRLRNRICRHNQPPVDQGFSVGGISGLKSFRVTEPQDFSDRRLGLLRVLLHEMDSLRDSCHRSLH